MNALECVQNCSGKDLEDLERQQSGYYDRSSRNGPRSHRGDVVVDHLLTWTIIGSMAANKVAMAVHTVDGINAAELTDEKQ